MSGPGTFELAVVVVQMLAAAGILGFWMTLGKADFDEPWRPPGFARHERAFTVPDTVAATLMIVSGLLVLGGHSFGRRLALVAAGMLVFLAVLDTVYMHQNDLFRRDHDGAMHAAIVTAIFAVAALMLAAYLP